ncbi:MAG: class I SAM-dependent methyltransferase [Deltaproteobacteria bacterium]|nr:class I SAM-dependent methyltransferase [Deltaproteobacteria bacterium]
MKPIETEADVFTLVRTSRALAVLASWSSLGLLQALAARGPMSLFELSTGLDLRALEITLPIMKHLGVVVGDAHRLALSDAGRKLLDERVLPGQRDLEMLAESAQMSEVLKSGGPVKDSSGRRQLTHGGVRRESREDTSRFLEMLYRMSARSSERVFEWLSPFVPVGGAVLDVGGGHGRYARRFVDAGYRATLLDVPMVIELARERHGESMSYLEGDFHTLEVGGPYDLVFLSNIAHGEPDEKCRQLITRLAQVTKPGGVVAIKDMFLDDHGQDPEVAVFFGITMLFYTEAGRSHTAQAARSWFEAAGLVGAKFDPLGSFSIAWAKRPEGDRAV